MGKSNRNGQLARRYLRATGVAAVWIDADGHVGAQDIADVDIGQSRVAYCCPRGAHFVLAYRLQLWMQDLPERPDQAAVAAELEELALAGGVGLSPHAMAVQRAIDTVDRIEREFGTMQCKGELKEFNAAFEAARALDPSMRYLDYVLSTKAAMLDAISR
jgi:hypothetical protein